VGQWMEKYAMKHEDKVKMHVKAESHKWIPIFIKAMSNMLATILALKLTRVLIMVTSSMKGGELMMQSIKEMCVNRQVDLLYPVPATFGLMSAGVFAQLFAGRVTQRVFNLLFFPLAMSEYLLTSGA
jgi:hypothetical protein